MKLIYNPLDQWWENEEGVDWSREETLELIFTVREFWPGWPKIPMDWELVSTDEDRI